MLLETETLVDLKMSIVAPSAVRVRKLNLNNMPLQKINSFNLPALSDQNIVDLINLVINYTNDLEARLAALEHPVERLSDEE